MTDRETAAPIHVVAGVLRDTRGRVLLTQRPHGKQHAGLWEFPGGKLEAGESARTALQRELHEELGIVAVIGRRRIDVADAHVRLDAYEVDHFSGLMRGRESQALAWVDPWKIESQWLPPLDLPIVASIRLPDRYLITPNPAPGEESDFLDSIAAALGAGIRLVQLRAPGWSRDTVTPLARRAHGLCRERGARLLLNADFELASVLGLDGVHLPYRIASNLNERPIPASMLLGVSCHSPMELAYAATMGADFATLSPVLPTTSHPRTTPLGWENAGEMLASANLPVYALGGLSVDDLAHSFDHGFQGIAAIRALWPNHATPADSW